MIFILVMAKLNVHNIDINFSKKLFSYIISFLVPKCYKVPFEVSLSVTTRLKLKSINTRSVVTLHNREKFLLTTAKTILQDLNGLNYKTTVLFSI